MAKKNRDTMRESRHRRERAKISGSQGTPRLNVYRSLNHIYAQLIDDGQGVTLAAASSNDRELGGEITGKNKTEQAQLVGKAIAARAATKGIKKVIFDRGGYRYHGRVKALADAAREGGLEF